MEPQSFKLNYLTYFNQSLCITNYELRLREYNYLIKYKYFVILICLFFFYFVLAI